jgi:UDP-N-acetylglucosamine--N-acetylmuramyl-(pentapeptide) pyrophosphoryl-undecaprenol N-acetylglucosamine transferase
VRPEFYAANPEKGRSFLNIPACERILLVLGGSQGAAELNKLVESCLDRLTEIFFVVHQTGQAWNRTDTAAVSANAGENPPRRYIKLPYIKDEMPDVLAAATLVLGRAGAGTIWECAAVGRPMVLVPLSGGATRGDQIENAGFFEDKGAARMLVRPSAEELLSMLSDLANDGKRLTAMAAAAAQIGTMRGAPMIARHITEEIKREAK